MPTDTHIHLVSRRLGLTRRKSADWKTAREITDRLARFDPTDPVRFDYALCRIGILGICRTDLARSRCMDCLAAVCCPAGMRKIRNLSQRRFGRRSNIESPKELPAQPSTFDLRPSTYSA